MTRDEYSETLQKMEKQLERELSETRQQFINAVNNKENSTADRLLNQYVKLENQLYLLDLLKQSRYTGKQGQ